MKQILFSVIILLFAVKTFAQEDKTVQGIIFDKDSKQRITHVYLYNLRTGKGFYNNLKGEFTTTARTGDVLIAALENYAVDTLKIKQQNTVVLYLKRTSILLRDVIITDTVKSPKDQLQANRKEYSTIYQKGNNKDVFSAGGSNGLGGAGLSIDALYSMLSREGRNARKLQKIIERDYCDALINYRYSPSLINKVTGLAGKDLVDFIQQYSPSYQFVIEANDYEMINFIKSSYKQFLLNPAANRLPPLVPGK